MKNSYYYTVIISVMFLASSCTRDNYLDIKPKGSIIPSSAADYRLLLDNTFPDDLIGADVLTNGFDETPFYPIAFTDDIVFYDAFNLNQSLRRAYLFDDSFYTPLENDNDWDTQYNQIYLANIILEGLENLEDGNSQEIAELTAEARTHRAYAYFNLVNMYAVHYDPATAATDLGVPIREGTELENLDFTRASVQAVYDYIIDDLTSSIVHLQDSQPSDFIFRPSKAGANGLLAKVYLYQGAYDSALDAVNQALNFQNTLRDINDDEINSFGDVRSLPRIENDPEIIWYKLKNAVFPIFPSNEAVSLYEANDLRFEWFRFADEIVSTGAFIYDASVLGGNFSIGIHTPELYLIRAECNARLNNLTMANNDLNALREKRFIAGTYTPLSLMSAADLLAFVKEERRREHIGKLDRLFDIKRYNRFDNDTISLSHTYQGESATLLPNSLNWAFPIAERYIQINPEIEQNPRD